MGHTVAMRPEALGPLLAVVLHTLPLPGSDLKSQTSFVAWALRHRRGHRSPLAPAPDSSSEICMFEARLPRPKPSKEAHPNWPFIPCRSSFSGISTTCGASDRHVSFSRQLLKRPGRARPQSSAGPRFGCPAGLESTRVDLKGLKHLKTSSKSACHHGVGLRMV